MDCSSSLRCVAQANSDDEGFTIEKTASFNSIRIRGGFIPVRDISIDGYSWPNMKIFPFMSRKV